MSFFMFIPILGEDEAILTNIFFEMGWFNHQLARVDGVKNGSGTSNRNSWWVVSNDVF